MHVTTRIEGRKDEGLLGEKGGRGFPYIVFMDEEGSVLAQQGERTVAGFDATLKKLQRLFDLRAKARGGDAAAEIEVALLEGDLEIAAFDDVKRRLDGKKLTEAQVGLLSDLELSAMIGAVQNATDEAGARAAAKTVADAFAAGRKPLGKDKLRPFYFILLQYAHGERNPDLAQKALDAIKPIFKEAMGDDPRLDEWLRKQQDAIDELRAPPEEEEGCGEDEGMEEGCGED